MDGRTVNLDNDVDGAPKWLGREQLAVLPFAEAVQVLEDTLRSDFDPEQDGLRSRSKTPYGQLLQMPSATQQWCGTKLVTLRDDSGPSAEPAIQGIYALFEGRTMRPVAILEGAGLTALRTPAMTALAVKHLADGRSGRVAIFGSGVQARAHVDAVSAVYHPESIAVVGRNPHETQKLVDDIQATGIDSYVAGPEVVAEVDLILCCTSSSEPLFDGSHVQNHAMVAAIGAHDPGAREVDSLLVQSSTAVVESRTSAIREAGDLVIPEQSGEFHWDNAVPIQDVVCGRAAINMDRPRLFKGTGMPWQDLAVAASVYVRAAGATPS